MKLQKETKPRRPDAVVHGRWYNDACGTAFGMELVGERWSLLIVRELMFGALRFSGLRANLPGISAKVLTERLEKLEGAGVLVHRTLPAPSSARVYELTRWGYAAEPLIQELGRWAAQSSQHDPTLPLSPTSFLLSLRTMFDKDRAAGLAMRVGFKFPDVSLVADLKDGAMAVSRTDADGCEVVFHAPDGPALAGAFYVGMPLADVGIRLDGDPELAERFMDIFELPEKIG